MKEAPKFMTAKWFVAIWVINGSCFILNALLKLLMGKWILAIGDILIGCLSGYVVVRLTKVPAFCFYSDCVEILNRPITRPIKILISDISSIEKKGRKGFRILLNNQKPMNLRLSWLRAADRDLVVTEFQKVIKSTGTGDEAVSTPEKAQSNEAWF